MKEVLELGIFGARRCGLEALPVDLGQRQQVLERRRCLLVILEAITGLQLAVGVTQHLHPWGALVQDRKGPVVRGLALVLVGEREECLAEVFHVGRRADGNPLESPTQLLESEIGFLTQRFSATTQVFESGLGQFGDGGLRWRGLLCFADLRLLGAGQFVHPGCEESAMLLLAPRQHPLKISGQRQTGLRVALYVGENTTYDPPIAISGELPESHLLAPRDSCQRLLVGGLDFEESAKYSRLLRRLHPSAEITLVEFEGPASGEVFEGIEQRALARLVWAHYRHHPGSQVEGRGGFEAAIALDPRGDHSHRPILATAGDDREQKRSQDENGNHG